MVQGKFKSGRLRKRKVRVPGGRTVTRYLERAPKQQRCAVTGEPLHGIPRLSATKAKKAPKTLKRPERPYGGVLSSRAMRAKMAGEARLLSEGASGATQLFGVGTLCLKVAGRDAGKRCVIVDEQDGKFLVDGETRRRLVNPAHLEPLGTTLKLKKGASHAEVAKAFEGLGISARETKPKQAAPRPRKVRKAKQQPPAEKASEKAVKASEKGVKAAASVSAEKQPAAKPQQKSVAKPAEQKDESVAKPAPKKAPAAKKPTGGVSPAAK